MPTKIEWCDESWNPITGCEPISEGCRRCYAEKMAKRLAGRFGYPKDEPFKPGTIHWDKWKQTEGWKKPRRVFVCSMGDLFHKDVSFRAIMHTLYIIKDTPRHTFLVLTKRPDNFLKWIRLFNSDDGEECLPFYSEWMPKNLWLGVTTENQKQAEARIPILLKIPAAKRFVSCEPLLGPVDLRKYMWPVCAGWPRGYGSKREAEKAGAITYNRQKLVHADRQFIDWVICGKETGPGARHMSLEWARTLQRQCERSGTPFFYKNGSLDGRFWEQFPKG